MIRYVNKISIIILILLLTGCGSVRLNTSYGFMGPDTFVATDGEVEVRYWNGKCCCVAKKVLQSIVDQANNKEFNWKQMADDNFKEEKLKEQCKIEKEKEKQNAGNNL